MPTTLKAIETTYQGIKFRSRLEARWCVFFQELGIEWEYEKEGFELGKGIRYLPDFWLPKLKCWFEVKGESPSDEELKKAQLLRDQGDWPVVIASGQVGTGPHHCFAQDIGHSSGGCSEWEVRWYICDGCRRPKLSWGDSCHTIVGPGWAQHPAEWCGPTGFVRDPKSECGPKWNLHNVLLDAPIGRAIQAARAARFEFGARRRRR